jgi:hypothetical protein
MSTKKPRSLGELADRYAYVRDVLKKEAKRKVDECDEELARIRDELLSRLPVGDGGAVGKAYKAVVVKSQIPVINDFEALVNFAKKHKRLDLLSQRVSAEAVRGFWEASKTVPGVEPMEQIKLSVTKI